MTPLELLRKVPEVIDERGWWQGSYESPCGEVCLLGAIHVADGRPATDDDSKTQSSAAGIVEATLSQILDGEYEYPGFLHDFNDEADTVDEVKILIRKGIELLERAS